MFERFTEQARRIVVLAQEESLLLNHQQIGTEHLLLGLQHGGEDEIATALAAAGATLAAVRQRLEQSPGRGRKAPSGHIPFTARAKSALEQALRVSHRLGQDYIGPPHLLRGLLEIRDGLAVRILVELGVDTVALASVADQLARDSEPPGTQHSVSVGHATASAVPFPPGLASRARRLSADEITAEIDGFARALADHCHELAAGLRRYGRHEAGCDPAQGCTCGLAALLEVAELDRGEQA